MALKSINQTFKKYKNVQSSPNDLIKLYFLIFVKINHLATAEI